jgi:hypothetical protein
MCRTAAEPATADRMLRKREGLLIPIDLETVTEARLVAQAGRFQSAFEQILRRLSARF